MYTPFTKEENLTYTTYTAYTHLSLGLAPPVSTFCALSDGRIRPSIGEPNFCDFRNRQHRDFRLRGVAGFPVLQKSWISSSA